MNNNEKSNIDTPEHGYLVDRFVKNTKRVFFVFLVLVGLVEYFVYQQYKEFVQVYADNFPTVATAAAEKVADGGHYCIMAPEYLHHLSWLILNDFTELDIEKVIEQGVYFKLGFRGKVYTGVGQRLPHFELYSNGKRYLWSFSTQSFYEYRIQGTSYDRNLTAICADLAGKDVDRKAASHDYQKDADWTQKLYGGAKE